jgi:hypothetical protein
VPDAAAERHLGQIPLPQPVAVKRLAARRTREIESRDSERKESDVGVNQPGT